jgi:hypothetical protein
MSDTNPKTILLSPVEVPITREAKVAGANIRPGMLVERTAAGHTLHENGARRPHSTAGGPAQLSFAVEYDITGRTIDDEYVNNDNMIEAACRHGDQVYALLAIGQNVTVTGGPGSYLSSAGNGALRVALGESDDHIVAQAKELVNNSAGSAMARIKVEIMTGIANFPT